MKRLLTGVCACLAAAAVAAVPAAGAKSSASSSKVSAADEQYLQTSISGDRFEIIGGKLAEKSNNAMVRRLAKTLVNEHSKSLADAVKLARSLKIDVPSSPLPTQIWELKMVGALKGRAFNRAYSSLEVYDHIQDIDETGTEVSNGTNSEIRKDARMELPMLRMHLKMSRAALAASGK